MQVGADLKLDQKHVSPPERAAELYRTIYGRSPSLIAFAPGRVNLIGDHTDYCDGLVFPAALSDGCACAIGPRDHELAAVSAELAGEPVVNARGTILPEHLDGEPGWMRYAAGTFESMRTRFAADAGGANIAVASDVPTGSGLSSSASLEVSIATALEHLWGVAIDPIEKAKACQAAEHEYAGAPCGLMDQLVSVKGKTGCAIRIDCRDATTQAVPLPPATEAVFVIFDSSVTHANDDGGYAARRAACESSLPKLGVRALRDVTLADLGNLPADLTPEEVDAVCHVVSENARVEAFTSLLPAGKLLDAGRLMNESHRSLAETYRVSCPEVDTLAEIVRNQPGVFGARMTGGGFGGWIVSLMKADAAERTGESVREAYKSATGLETTCRIVEAGDGARLVR